MLSTSSHSLALISSLLILVLSSACTEEPSSGNTQTSDNDQGVAQSDASTDQAPGVDMPTSPEDMLATPEDMPEDQPDAARDMPADLGARDMDLDMPADLGTQDMPAEDMAPDMAEPEDMLMYPDADIFPCAHPADPLSNCDTGPHGPAAFVTEFVIVEDKTCCRDFDGDGDFENFIGDTLIKTARQSFNVNVNENIDTAIQTGALAFIFEFEDWQNDQYDPDITARILNGVDAMPPIADNLQSVGSFYPTPESYDPVTGDPLWGFTAAHVFNGMFEASGGTLRIYFPGIVDAVEIILEDVKVTANIPIGANLGAGGSVTMLDGELSGAIVREKFFDSLNTFSQTCACINAPIFEKNTNGSYSCLLTEDRCASDPDNACRLTGQLGFCAGLGLFSSSVDVDLDGDGKRDAFGFGARFTAVRTTLEAMP